MTPATYRSGGAHERISYVTSTVSLGKVLLAGTGRGVCGVLLGDDDAALLAALAHEFSRSILALEPAIPLPWHRAVRHAEREDPLLSKLHIGIRRDVFQAKLWHALL